MSETELLQAFRENRSEEAFAQLVRRYAGLVYSVAKRRLPGTALAEDITQIVFIRFAKAPPKVRNHAEIAAWLHRTTVHVTIDLWRSETRRRAREQQAVVMEPATPENAVWEDISPKLDEALNQLNDEDRQALLLRFFGQKAMRQVGAALGVSEDAAKMRVSRAVDRLRTQLGVGAAACTAAMLSTMLTGNSVEAAPSQLVIRLAAMKLPVAASVAVGGGWFAAFLRISKLKLAAGMVVLTVTGIGTVHLLRSLDAPLPRAAVTNPQTHPAGNTTGIANRERFDSYGFNPSAAPPSRQMLFHVVDAETGEGLANTKIRAAFFGAGGMGEGNDVVTDKNGDAVIPEPDDQVMNVFVVAERHVPKVVMFHGEGTPAEYTMKLDPATTAGGVIVDEQGLPVAGVKILIQNPGAKLDQAENVDFQTCPVTGRDDGSWSCNYIPKDYTNEIRFILKKPGYAVTFPVVPVAQVDLTNLVLVINRGFTITGQITDSQHRPITNARIKTLDGNASERQSAKADERGVFTLSGVTGDNMVGPRWTYEGPALETNSSGGVIIRAARPFYGFVKFIFKTNDGVASMTKQSVRWPGEPPHSQARLAVQANGYASQTATVVLLNPTNIADLMLSPGNIFRGQVVDEAGNPIPNAVVRTDWDFKNQIPTQFDWTTRTDRNGEFEWDSAPVKKICYWFEADGYNAIRGMPLLADGTDHEITLKHKAAK